MLSFNEKIILYFFFQSIGIITLHYILFGTTIFSLLEYILFLIVPITPIIIIIIFDRIEIRKIKKARNKNDKNNME